MQENIEIWKDVAGYDGVYQISNLGRIRVSDICKKRKDGRIYKKKGSILKPATLNSGYLCVALYKNNEIKKYLIHRLVAFAFLENDNSEFNIINHKDENKLNNIWSNLEWCNKSYNAKYNDGAKIRRNKCNDKFINGKCSKSVVQKLNGNIIKIYPSVMQVERENGFCFSRIARCCREESNGYGYEWEYLK